MEKGIPLPEFPFEPVRERRPPDQRLMREMRRSSQPPNRYRRILLTGYGLTSIIVSAVVMRGEGLDWGTMARMILAP